jgi:hypothetical protein
MKHNRASALTPLLLSTVLLVVAASTSGCASEQKVLRAPHYTLTHPDYWKVESVAKQDGEPTLVKIGRYSSTVMNEGVGADESTLYESSESEVEVRLYTWADPSNDPPTMAVVNKLANDATLELTKHGRISADRGECGKDFQRKYKVLGNDQEPLDLVKQPGFRTIVVGGKNGTVLLGVVARVPYEQDQGLYCHNLNNLRLRLDLLLKDLKADESPPAAPATAAAASPPAAPANAAPPATPSDPAPAAPAQP